MVDYSNMAVELTKEQYQYAQREFRGRAFMKVENGRYLIKTENTVVIDWLNRVKKNG